MNMGKPRCGSLAFWAALLAMFGCSSSNTPENVATKFVQSMGDSRVQTEYINPADSMRVQPDSSAGFGIMLGRGLQARWVDATSALERLAIDSSQRLPVPVGDTAVVVVYFHSPSLAAADSALSAAVDAGLVTDKASTDVFLKRTWSTVPLEQVQDTLWLIISNGRWRVWTGADARARVDSLKAIVDPSVQDTAVVPIDVRLAASEEMRRILRATPPAIIDRRKREEAVEASRALQSTQEFAKEFRPRAVITTSGERQIVTFQLAGESPERLFSVRFFLRDEDGYSSAIINDMIWGGSVKQFDVTPAGESYGSTKRLKNGAATVEFVSAFEMDVARMRRAFGLR